MEVPDPSVHWPNEDTDENRAYNTDSDIDESCPGQLESALSIGLTQIRKKDQWRECNPAENESALPGRDGDYRHDSPDLGKGGVLDDVRYRYRYGCSHNDQCVWVVVSYKHNLIVLVSTRCRLTMYPSRAPTKVLNKR